MIQATPPPVDELVNTLEFETAAQQKLDPGTFALISGSDRKPFERITLRPRMMVNTTKLDLRLNLFGTDMLAPIIAGPISDLKRFHAEGDTALYKGASDAKAVFIVTEKAEFPASKADWWYQVSPRPDAARIEKAATAGAKALVVTLADTGTDWNAMDNLRRGMKLPVVLKGIMSADEAKDAASKGVQGIVVSNYTGTSAPGLASAMEVLPGIVDAVAGRIPVLVDGGFRRGTDVMMALGLGASAVLVARPVAWGLSGYGDVGVRTVLEMLQTELGRTMGMCGKPTLKSIDRTVVKVHRW
jgi:4-hydroxymandelate oxidase